MTQKVANGVLSGVVKVSGIVTSSVANSKVGKKFLGLLPGEMVLATLDGFSMSFISCHFIFYVYIHFRMSFILVQFTKEKRILYLCAYVWVLINKDGNCIAS